MQSPIAGPRGWFGRLLLLLLSLALSAAAAAQQPSPHAIDIPGSGIRLLAPNQ